MNGNALFRTEPSAGARRGELRRLLALEWNVAIPEPSELERLATTYRVRLSWLRGNNSTEDEILRRVGLSAVALASLTAEERERFLTELDAVQ